MLVAGGCDRNNDSPPRPAVAQTPSAEARPAAPDTTPKASDAFKEGAPSGTTSTHEKPVDQSRAMTKPEESVAMPMPGQANDHSTLATEGAKR